MLEGYAARLATVRHTQEQLKPLIRKNEVFRKHLEKDDLKALPRINTELHNMIYALSGSPKLIKMINDLKEQTFVFARLFSKQDSAQLATRTTATLLAMMQERRSEEVEQLVRETYLRGLTAVLRQYDREQRDRLA